MYSNCEHLNASINWHSSAQNTDGEISGGYSLNLKGYGWKVSSPEITGICTSNIFDYYHLTG